MQYWRYFSLIISISFLFLLTPIYGDGIKTVTLQDVKQINVDGFGEIANRYAFSMESFNGKLYVGTSNITWPIPGIFQFALAYPLIGNGAQIWEYDENREEPWQMVVKDGLGKKSNLGIRYLKSIEGYLYAVTVNHEEGMEVWRSADGTRWEVLMEGGFGCKQNTSGRGIEFFRGYIYVSAENRNKGAEIWRTADGKKWEAVITGGMGNAKNVWFADFTIFQNQMYVGTMNNKEGMSLYRTKDGKYFEPLFTNGLTTKRNGMAMKLIVFQEKLFFSAMNWVDGFSVFMSDDGLHFKEVLSNGFNSRDNAYVWNMAVYNGRLYAGSFQNSYLFLKTGVFSLYSSAEGENWIIENDRAFADPNKNIYLAKELGDYGIRTLKVHNGKLYIGTATAYNSCKVYQAIPLL